MSSLLGRQAAVGRTPCAPPSLCRTRLSHPFVHHHPAAPVTLQHLRAHHRLRSCTRIYGAWFRAPAAFRLKRLAVAAPACLAHCRPPPAGAGSAAASSSPSSACGTAAAAPPWQGLPDDVKRCVLALLAPRELARAAHTCRDFADRCAASRRAVQHLAVPPGLGYSGVAGMVASHAAARVVDLSRLERAPGRRGALSQAPPHTPPPLPQVHAAARTLAALQPPRMRVRARACMLYGAALGCWLLPSSACCRAALQCRVCTLTCATHTHTHTHIASCCCPGGADAQG